ncbi:MAG: hypothetical protein AAF725_20595 [Acidobacteriota bacterium]
MSDQDPKTLADRWIEDEGFPAEADSPEAPSQSTLKDPWFETMIESERLFERRVRRIAIAAWMVTFACLVWTAGMTTMLSHVDSFQEMGGEGSLPALVRFSAMVAIMTGSLSLPAALTTSLMWLFRSRAPSLRVIERRLAALESLLLEERRR